MNLLKNISIEELKKQINASKIVARFQRTVEKQSNAFILNYQNKGFFLCVKNKNKVFHIFTYLIDFDILNEALFALKEKITNDKIIYFWHKETQGLFHSIKGNKKYMHQYILQPKTILPKPIANHQCQEIEAINSAISTLFQESFTTEFDENTAQWLNDFSAYKGEKQIICTTDKNTISASALYWVYNNSIYLFLIATKPLYRRQNKALSLLKNIQEKYPNKSIELSAWENTDAQLFYKKIGFQQQDIIAVGL